MFVSNTAKNTGVETLNIQNPPICQNPTFDPSPLHSHDSSFNPDLDLNLASHLPLLEINDNLDEMLFQHQTLNHTQSLTYSSAFDPNIETLYSMVPSLHQEIFFTPPTIQPNVDPYFTQNKFADFSSPKKGESPFENTLNDFLGSTPIYDSYDSPPKFTTRGPTIQEPFGSLNSSFFKNASDT